MGGFFSGNQNLDFKLFGSEDYNISWQTKWQLHTIVQGNSTFTKQKSCFACFFGAFIVNKTSIEISTASTYTEACICKAISYSETRDHEFNFVV